MKNHFNSFRYTISVVGISLIYVILIASLFWFYDKEKFVEILSSDRTLYSLKLSLICATIVALVSTILAIPDYRLNASSMCARLWRHAGSVSQSVLYMRSVVPAMTRTIRCCPWSI